MTTLHACTGPERDADDVAHLWRFARQRGMDRERFEEALSDGGLSAALAACLDLAGPAEQREEQNLEDESSAPDANWFKDTSPFVAHDNGRCLEARLEHMQGVITPTNLFFVRNNSVSLDVEPDNWQLSIEGDAVTKPLTLSYTDILTLPSRTVIAYLDCAGNQRAMFDLVNGECTEGTQWRTGGVSNGEWVGTPLRNVLTMAGITDEAVCVMLVGLDTESPEKGFRSVIPVEKAMHPDTLLAYALNGEVLPRDHGFPMRALVPGWVGSTNVKWLGRVEVSTKPIWTRNNTTSYVLIGDEYPPEGEAQGQVTHCQVIKSALALPWPADLRAEPHRIHGYAHSPDGPISNVEWSLDSGTTWQDARLHTPQVQYSWARFEFAWDPAPGSYTLMTRATDEAGNTQPDVIPFNQKGYLFNQPIPHPVRVT